MSVKLESPLPERGGDLSYSESVKVRCTYKYNHICGNRQPFFLDIFIHQLHKRGTAIQ
jgi:hypothetical protein